MWFSRGSGAEWGEVSTSSFLNGINLARGWVCTRNLSAKLQAAYAEHMLKSSYAQTGPTN